MGDETVAKPTEQTVDTGVPSYDEVILFAADHHLTFAEAETLGRAGKFTPKDAESLKNNRTVFVQTYQSVPANANSMTTAARVRAEREQFDSEYVDPTEV
jgi:hypothetical protein